MTEMKITRVKTSRGFILQEFTDLYGAKCTLQESSLATDDAIWLGVDKADPKLMRSDARRLGIQTTDDNGWCSYPVPPEVLISTRMHLNREQVQALLPILQKFVETGRL